MSFLEKSFKNSFFGIKAMSAKKLRTNNHSTNNIASLDLIDIERRITEIYDELDKLLTRKEEIYTNHTPKKRPSYLC